MPWKCDDSGNFVKDANGNPIFILDGGEERSVDFSAMSSALSTANREAAERKTRIRELEASAKVWDGIDDVAAFIAAAKKDAEAVKAMSDKEKDAEAATQARVQAAVMPLEKRIAELTTERDTVREQFHTSLIRSMFGTSEYIARELVSAALVQDLFAKHFSVDESGNIFGKDNAGNVIYDENGPAGFDAALRRIVNDSPHKSIVLKGSTASGSGAGAGTGNSGGMPQKNYADCKTIEEKTAWVKNHR